MEGKKRSYHQYMRFADGCVNWGLKVEGGGHGAALAKEGSAGTYITLLVY